MQKLTVKTGHLLAVMWLALIALTVADVAGAIVPNVQETIPGMVVLWLFAAAITGFTLRGRSKPAPAPIKSNAATSNRRSLPRQRPVTPVQPAAVAPVFGSFRVDTGSGTYLDVLTTDEGDGNDRILVTAGGYTNSQYKNRVRPRIEGVRSVRWLNPQGLGKHKLSGIVPTTRLLEAQNALRNIK